MIGETILSLSHGTFNQVRGHLLEGPYFKKRCLSWRYNTNLLYLHVHIFLCLVEALWYYVSENNNVKRYFRGRNFRGQKLSRFSQFLPIFAKVSAFENSKTKNRESFFLRK